MSNQKIILESLALDLKRVALGLQSESVAMAKRFAKEALRRKQEVDIDRLEPYMRNILERLEEMTKSLERERTAEDALMLSILIQNYVQRKLISAI